MQHMQPEIGTIVGQHLLKANWQKKAAHLSKLVERGWASLWPSKLSCPTAAALIQMKNKDLLDRLAAEEIEFSAAVEESLAWDPLDENTLLLFEAGHFWERVVADALVKEYGGSRNIRIENKKRLVAGEIDVLTDGPDGTLIAWEIKSTKKWAMDSYGPAEAHIVQLAIYKHLYNTQNPDLPTADIDDAYLIYVPNDKHPSTVLRNMKIVHLDDALSDARLNYIEVGSRLGVAQQYVEEATLDTPPLPFKNGDEWPCSRTSRGKHVPVCPFYATCYPHGPTDEVWDIPF